MLEKAKWLNGLYEKFYEKATFKQIRLAIDYKTEEYINLKQILNTNEDLELQGNLVDYLNFFEFIATLKEKRQLKITDINMVFGYYINDLKDSDFIIQFIKKSGFQNLEKLIIEISKLRNTY